MTEPLSTQALVKQYLNICNDVLLSHRQSPLLKQVLALVNRLYSQDTITFKVVNDDDEPLGYFSTRFVDGTFTPVEEGRQDPDIHLQLQRSYLEQVVNNAQDYMDHPTKLDWDWLTGEVKSQ